MTKNDKRLFLAAALLGIALGYYANSVLLGNLMTGRPIAMACRVIDAAQQMGQLSTAQGDALFFSVVRSIDSGRVPAAGGSRARLCSPSP